MQEFYPKLGSVLDAMLVVKHPKGIGSPCICKRDGAVRTCYCFDCDYFESCCSDCFRQHHRLIPLHWVHMWNGRFLEKKDISHIGHFITFGHDSLGNPCPHARSAIDFIIVHVNGVHQTKALFCACIGRKRDRFDQLLQSQVFPATVRLPETGFTFRLLEDFHLQTLTSKKTPYDYLSAIRQKTSSPFLDDVPVGPILDVAIPPLIFLRIHILNFSEYNGYGACSKV